MLIGSTAEFYWLNNEEIHIVGCPVYLGNYIKIIIRALNVFLILVYFFIYSRVTSLPVTMFPRFTVIVFVLLTRDVLSPLPPSPLAPPHTIPKEPPKIKWKAGNFIFLISKNVIRAGN